MRAGLLPDEIGERDLKRVGDEEEVRVAGVAYTRLVPLNGSALDSDAVTELFLRQADRATGVAESLTQFSAAGGDPLGRRGSS